MTASASERSKLTTIIEPEQMLGIVDKLLADVYIYQMTTVYGEGKAEADLDRRRAVMTLFNIVD